MTEPNPYGLTDRPGYDDALRAGIAAEVSGAVGAVLDVVYPIIATALAGEARDAKRLCARCGSGQITEVSE